MAISGSTGKPKLDEQAVLGISGLQGYTFEDQIVIYPLEDIEMDTYRQMIHTDDAIDRASYVKGILIANFMDEYMHPDPKIQDFVRDVLENIETSLIELYKLIIRDTLIFGMHASEIVWYIGEDGKYRIRKFVLLKPEKVGLIIDKQTGDIAGIYYSRGYSAIPNVLVQSDVVFPPEKVLLIRTFEQTPRARRIYWAWQLKRGAIRYYAKALEKHGAPWVVGKSMNTEEMIGFLRELLSLGSIAIRPEDEIELLQPRNIAGEAFEKAIHLSDRAIFRQFGIPELLLTGDVGGSYSLGRQLFEMLLEELKPEVEQFGKQLIQGLVKHIINLNFEGVEDSGMFPRKEKLTPDEMFKLTQVLYQLLTTGVLSPEKDAEWIRRKLDLPDLPGGTEKQEKKENKSEKTPNMLK